MKKHFYIIDALTASAFIGWYTHSWILFGAANFAFAFVADLLKEGL